MLWNGFWLCCRGPHIDKLTHTFSLNIRSDNSNEKEEELEKWVIVTTKGGRDMENVCRRAKRRMSKERVCIRACDRTNFWKSITQCLVFISVAEWLLRQHLALQSYPNYALQCTLRVLVILTIILLFESFHKVQISTKCKCRHSEVMINKLESKNCYFYSHISSSLWGY